MRYRLVRADIEGEIDMDLDTGPTTFYCIPRFVPHTILFDSRCYNGFFARPARKIHYSAPRDIIHVDNYTAAVLHYT